MVRSGRNSNSSEILCMSLLPASIKRIGSKTTEKRWRHCFSHYMSMFCCHGHQSFHPVCPKALCGISPTRVMLHIKFDKIGHLASEIIKLRVCNSKLSGLIRPKIELDRAFMPGLVSSNFDDDSTKNERASMETPLCDFFFF